MGKEPPKKVVRRKRPVEHDLLLNRLIEEAVNDDRGLFDSLSTSERQLAVTILEEYLAADGTDRASVINTLWEVDYIRRPVPIRKFIIDKEYIGLSTAGLNEKWIRVLEEIAYPGSTICEVILGGSLGTGKTTVGMALCAYKLYEMSCLRNAQSYYGLLDGSMIVFGIYSITKGQASNASYWKLKEYVDHSSYFKVNAPRDPQLESKIRFLKQKLQVISGSRSFHSIGIDLYSFCYSGRHCVWTEDGPINIVDLTEKSKRIWTWTGYEYRLTDESLSSVRTGYKSVIPVTLSSGQRLELTPEQPVLIHDQYGDRWVRADELYVGDKLLEMPVDATSETDTRYRQRCDTDYETRHEDMGFASIGRFSEEEKRHRYFCPVSSATYERPSPRILATGLVIVVQIDPPSALQPVYDILEVPRTHAFLTGIEINLPPVVGKNCLDEANFMQSKLDKSTNRMVGQAYELYNSTLNRLISRFARAGGTMPGIALLMSSKTTTTSFTENRLRELTGLKDVEEVRGPITPRGATTPTAYYASFPVWDIFPNKYIPPSKKTFLVEVGDNTNKSRILEEGDTPREEARTIRVPMSPLLYARFRDDVDQSLREFAGVGTNSISPFVRDPKYALNAISQEYKNPFPKDTLPICVGNDQDLCDLFDIESACQIERGCWRPRMAPDRPRHIHIDLSATEDATGISMGFHDGNKRIGREREDGAKVMVIRPIIRMDFVQRVHAETDMEIDHERIFSFVLFLNQFYVLQEVTLDGFESRMIIQRLNAHGIRSRRLSLDRTLGPYMSWRSSLREQRLVIPYTEYDEKLKRFTHPRFHSEATNLVFDQHAKKVDHPDFNPDNSPGEKDLCDSIAGVNDGIHTLLEKLRGGRESVQSTEAHRHKADESMGEWNSLNRNVVVK